MRSPRAARFAGAALVRGGWLVPAAGVVLAFALFTPVGPAAGQEAGARIAVALVPDTVRVGEEFLLGVTVRTGPAERVLFPAVLSLGELLEQRGPAEVRDDGAVGRQRVYYRLVAWKAGSHDLPAFEVALRRNGEETTLAIEPPPIHVASVLPEDAEGLELREARPFLRLTGFPWWLALLALLALAGFLLWLWRRRRRTGEPAVPPHPAEAALRRLERLREEWMAGGMPGDRFFDRFDRAFREYAEATRGWSAGRPLRALANGDGKLAGVLRRSALVRFARLGENRQGGIRAIAAGEAWIRDEWQEPEEVVG